jgi:hypothetical protein
MDNHNRYIISLTSSGNALCGTVATVRVIRVMMMGDGFATTKIIAAKKRKKGIDYPTATTTVLRSSLFFRKSLERDGCVYSTVIYTVLQYIAYISY